MSRETGQGITGPHLSSHKAERADESWSKGFTADTPACWKRLLRPVRISVIIMNLTREAKDRREHGESAHLLPRRGVGKSAISG